MKNTPKSNPALEALRRNVTGRIERGEGVAIEAIVEQPTEALKKERLAQLGARVLEILRERAAHAAHLDTTNYRADRRRELKSYNSATSCAEIESAARSLGLLPEAKEESRG